MDVADQRTILGRSALAAKSLADMGYENVENLQGGWGAWMQSGLPVEQA